MVNLSIIIPVYKVEKYIRKTLESILSQQYDDNVVEVIVVNDGTPDNSMTIVNEFKVRINNLIVVNQDNKGLSGARNTGLAKARGKYVWFVDSDDWLHEGALHSVLNSISNESNDIYCFKIREFDEDGKILCDKYSPYHTSITMLGVDFLNSSISCAPMQQYVISREFLNKNKLVFVEGIVHEDIEFAPRMLLAGRTVKYEPIVSYCYLRRKGDNITGGKEINEKRLNSLKFILKEYTILFEKEKRTSYKKAIGKIQKIAVYAIFGFSSIEQIKNNYQNAFDGLSYKIYRKVVWSNLKYNIGIKSYIWDVLFLISPVLFKKVSSKRIGL